MDSILVEYGRTTAMPVGELFDADAPENIQTSPTLASGDVQISQDGGSFSNVTNLPSEIGSSGLLTWTPASTELDCAYAYLRFVDQTATKEWADKAVLILTKDNSSAFYGVDVNTDSSGNVTVGTNNDKTGYSLDSDQSGVTVGTVNTIGTTGLNAINAEVDTALSDYDALVPADLPSNFAALAISAGGIVDANVEQVNGLDIAGNANTPVDFA